MNQRLIYLDRLKVFMTILVVFHHTAVTYGGAGGWFYYEHGDNVLVNALLTMMTVIDQTFFMGMFFFISGYVTPASYDRHKGFSFLKARLIRFGIPLLFFMLVISPLLQYVSSAYKGSFSTYLQDEALVHPIRGLTDFAVGPLWYLEALFLFLAGYTAFRVWKAKRHRGEPLELRPLLMVRYIVIISIANYLVRMVFPVGTAWLNLQLAYFPAYIALFMAGIAAYRGNWLQQLTDRGARRWKWAVIAMIILFPAVMAAGGALDGNTAVFMGGWSWQSAYYSIMDPAMGLGISYMLLVWFRKRWNREATRFTRWLSGNAFLVYILHALFVTFVAFALRQLAWHPLVKFIVTGQVAVILSYAAASIIRSVPGVKKIV